MFSFFSWPVYVVVTLRIKRCKIQTVKISNFYSLNAVTLLISSIRDQPQHSIWNTNLLHCYNRLHSAHTHWLKNHLLSEYQKQAVFLFCALYQTLSNAFKIAKAMYSTIVKHSSYLTTFKKQWTLDWSLCFPNFSPVLKFLLFFIMVSYMALASLC